MSPVDLLSYAGIALGRQRLRTGLSLLGVAIGVSSVVLLTGLGEGARRYVVREFSSLGTNLIIVIPGMNETTGSLPGIGGAPQDLTLDDARAIQRRFPEIRRLAPMAMGTDAVSYLQRSRQVPIIGSTSAFKDLRQLGIADGQFLPEMELDRGAPIAVLGKKVAKELFAEQRPIGKVVRVGDFRMKVIGVMDSRGVHLGLDIDEAVLVPVATGMRIFNRSSLFRIVIETRSHADLDLAKEKVLALLKERHQEEDVTCLTQDAVVSTLSSILSILTFALGGIGAISLTVAGIGIMNVMLVSVSERTFEVGLLKALGAQRGQILLVFLIEATLLSTSGGVIGLLFGLSGLEMIHWVYPKFPAASPVWAVSLALVVSSLVGIGFGLLPAARASRLDPVNSLARGA